MCFCLYIFSRKNNNMFCLSYTNGSSASFPMGRNGSEWASKNEINKKRHLGSSHTTHLIMVHFFNIYQLWFLLENW